MPTSDAQIAANRRNSLLSTGPKTEAGKARSRRNALKHGLTGEGVALPDEDAAEVASRFQTLVAELCPSGLASQLFIHRFAYLSVRLERCERLDTAIYSKRIRHADADFVDLRLAQVETIASRLNQDPMTAARRLQMTPEGIDLLIGQWGNLREDLMNLERNAWTLNHWSRLERLLGRPEGDFRMSRAHALTQGLGGFFANINPSEIEGLEPQQSIEWARSELASIIDAEVERLKAARQALDPSIIEQDRLEAADRCLFDLQPAMNQVRKYEAATERGMYKALKEFRAVEAELKANGTAAENNQETAEMASFEPEGQSEEETETEKSARAPRYQPAATQIPETIHFPASRTLDDAPYHFGNHESHVC